MDDNNTISSLKTPSRFKQKNIIEFNNPAPAREISMIYSKTQLKLPIINALKTTISSVIRGQIEYNDVKVMSPK